MQMQGKSGVVLKHRDALRQLLKDVLSGEANYKAILVYDVSRWGDFQTMTKERTMNSSVLRLEYLFITAPSPLLTMALLKFTLESLKKKYGCGI